MSSTASASTSSIWRVPANQRLTGPICPSAARVPISLESSARTAGLVGASGASRLMHCSPRQRAFRSTAAFTASPMAHASAQASSTARAAERVAGSCTSMRFVAPLWDFIVTSSVVGRGRDPLQSSGRVRVSSRPRCQLHCVLPQALVRKFLVGHGRGAGLDAAEADLGGDYRLDLVALEAIGAVWPLLELVIAGDRFLVLLLAVAGDRCDLRDGVEVLGIAHEAAGLDQRRQRLHVGVALLLHLVGSCRR